MCRQIQHVIILISPQVRRDIDSILITVGDDTGDGSMLLWHWG